MHKMVEIVNFLGKHCEGDREEEIAQWFEISEAERNRKIDAYLASIAELEKKAIDDEAEARRLKANADTAKRRAEALREQLKPFLESQKLKTLKTSNYKVTLVKNGGKLPVVVQKLAAELPEKYQRVSVTPNLITIRRDLEAGKKLSFAYLGERSSRVKITDLSKPSFSTNAS